MDRDSLGQRDNVAREPLGMGARSPATRGARPAVGLAGAGCSAGPRAAQPAHRPAAPEVGSAHASGRGGSLTSVQSSTPGTAGGDAVSVVSVRPLLGENQTYSVTSGAAA